MKEAPVDRGERIAWQLDWNLLRTFMVIVQEGGITAAAERLLLKQPTVSNALKRLEDRLGKRLIDRSPVHFRVTDAGKALYEEVLEIHGSVARLTVAIREIHDEIRGHIRIRLATHVVFPVLDEVLRSFSKEHRHVTFDIGVMASRDVVKAILEKNASLGICLVDRNEPGLQYDHMYREHFGYFCGPDHHLFGKRGLTLDDLKGETSVSFATDRLQDVLRPVAILRAQINIDDTIRATSSHLEEVRRLIVNGVGIGPLPIHVVSRDVRDGLLWQLPPYEVPPAIDIFMVTNPRSRLNRAEEGFIAGLRSKVAALSLAERTYPQ